MQFTKVRNEDCPNVETEFTRKPFQFSKVVSSQDEIETLSFSN